MIINNKQVALWGDALRSSNPIELLRIEAMSAMAASIYELVLSRRSVSFVELEKGIEGFAGEKAMILHGDGYDNIVLWDGVSEEAAAALDELRSDGRIHFTPTNVLVYLIDGIVPDLPIAKSRRKYKKPHWLPAVLNPGMEEG